MQSLSLGVLELRDLQSFVLLLFSVFVGGLSKLFFMAGDDEEASVFVDSSGLTQSVVAEPK
jgi:hypothetical protein